ncbi:alpha/beta hydrolase fold domain-containing protein [Actinocorallia lasiicapitis]
MIIERRDGPGRASRYVSRTLRTVVRPTFERLPFSPRGFAVAALGDRLLAAPPLRGTRVEPVGFPDFTAEWVAAPGSAPDRTVLYFHGGGFVAFGLRSHRRLTSRISAACGAPVLSVAYRMLPAVDLAASVQDCVEAYRWLLEGGRSPAHVVFAGDSAGGTLTYLAALQAVAEGLPAPAALVALSPWLDFDCGAKARHPAALADPFIPVSALARLAPLVCGDRDPAALSPLRADLSVLPPSLLLVGGAEVLLLDAQEMAGRLDDRHVLQIWDGQPHVFPVFADLLPEGRAAIEEIGAFVRAAFTPG